MTTAGDRGAGLLGEAVAATNVNQYRTIETAEPQALVLLDGVREMYELARTAVMRAGFPVS
ncbi:MAG: hypothetical protein KGP12_02780 [Actinomycetales bacterium]|nr:hypothetical protein [Actinomycetales bacterium]